jgi:hypothetical protein
LPDGIGGWKFTRDRQALLGRCAHFIGGSCLKQCNRAESRRQRMNRRRTIHFPGAMWHPLDSHRKD